MKKMRLGWITFTCSEDSTIVFLELMNKHFFEFTERIEFVYCKALKPVPSIYDVKDIDVFFIEGAVSTADEEKQLKHIRKVSKYIVAVGACACTGYPSAQRNMFSQQLLKTISPRLNRYHLNAKVFPLKKYVKIDDHVMGCPMQEAQFMQIMNKYISIFSD